MRGGGAGGDLGGDRRAGAEAGVDEAGGLQPVERFRVERQPLGLEDYLAVPVDSEPGEVLDDRVDMLGAGAAGIDVLDPQKEGAVAAPGEIVGEQGRESVAQMQPTGRARRETGDDAHQDS